MQGSRQGELSGGGWGAIRGSRAGRGGGINNNFRV